MRRASVNDAAWVTELLSRAFYDDPAWGWAFPSAERRLDQYRLWWALFVQSALPYEWVWTTDDRGAVAMWIPPGCRELSDEHEATVEPLLREQLGTRADDVLELLDRFDANHPHDRPHYYLSMLGTHPDHRGEGNGMRLLAANLSQLDDLGLPAYLESSNPVNDRRYEQLGFERIGEFSAPGGGPTLACMWRDPR